MGETTTEQEKVNAYLFEVTSLAKNEDGTVGEERKTICKEYAFVGELDETILDYGKYWDVDTKGGSLNLVAEDGSCIDCGLDCCLNCVYGWGFRGYPVLENVEGLCATRRWFELSLGDERKTVLRVTLLDGMPKIDREKTIANSDISEMALHCVKLYGRPLFEDGDTVGEKDTKYSTVVLRTTLVDELNAMWESYIAAKSGADVAVKLDKYISADSIGRKLRITAKTRDDLDAALKAIGVNNPAEVAPNVVYGNGGADSEAAAFQADVLLTNQLD